jgi:hypothetical protein
VAQLAHPEEKFILCHGFLAVCQLTTTISESDVSPLEKWGTLELHRHNYAVLAVVSGPDGQTMYQEQNIWVYRSWKLAIFQESLEKDCLQIQN